VRSRRLTVLLLLPLALLLAAGGTGLLVRAKRAREWPRHFSGVGPDLPFQKPVGLTSASFSPGGEKLLLTTGSEAIEIWNVDAHQKTFTETSTDSPLFYTQFSPDGKYILMITGMNLDSVTLKDATTGATVTSRRDFVAAVSCLAFSPSGRLLALGDNQVTLCHIPSLTTYKTLDTAPVAVAFSPDEKILATIDSVGLLKLWSVSTGKVLRQKNLHQTRVSTISFSPDGTRLAVVGMDKQHRAELRLWETATGKQIQTARTSFVGGVTYLPEGLLLYCPTAKQIALLDKNGVSHPLLETEEEITGAMPSRDGKRIAAWPKNNTNTVLIWPLPERR
jgi:WD40 repeat protein